jgi:hypothetical protein
MAGGNQSGEELAHQTFVISTIGIGLYIASVIVFVLL